MIIRVPLRCVSASSFVELGCDSMVVFWPILVLSSVPTRSLDAKHRQRFIALIPIPVREEGMVWGVYLLDLQGQSIGFAIRADRVAQVGTNLVGTRHGPAVPLIIQSTTSSSSRPAESSIHPPKTNNKACPACFQSCCRVASSDC